MGIEDWRTRFLGRRAYGTPRPEEIQSVQASKRPLLVYDVDCGACARFKRAVEFLDPRGLMDFISIERAQDLGLLEALSNQRMHASFHLIKSDEDVESGAEAFPSLVRMLPLGWLTSKMLASTPGGPRATAWVYSTAARLHGRACERGSPRSETVGTDEATMA